LSPERRKNHNKETPWKLGAKLNYLGTTVTRRNYKQIKSRECIATFPFRIINFPITCLRNIRLNFKWVWNFVALKEVFENRMLRRIFGHKREEVIGGWRKLHNDELHKLYSSPNIIRMIKSRRMRRLGDVTRLREMRNTLPRFLGYVWLQMGYGLENGFIDYLYTPFEITSNYSAIADLHTLQITTALAKPFFSVMFLQQSFPCNGF
jgi:hypothetical protein